MASVAPALPSCESAPSVWTQDFAVPASQALTTDLSCDVCIVGAGIAGLTTAYLLARERLRVVVLDDGEIGSGETQHTTAHLSNAIDARYSQIIRWRGTAAARLVADSHTAAIERIVSIATEEGIDCDLERLDGFLFGATSNDESVEHEFAAARDAGVPGVELLPRFPIPSVTTGPCVRFPRQAQFHPLRYLAGLVGGIVARNGAVFGNSHVETVDGRTKRVVTRGGATVFADAIVIATNTPVFDRVAIHTKQAPYMTYVLGFRLQSGQIPPGLYWDTADPFHYARLHSPQRADQPRDGVVLLVGGEDHKTGQASDGAARFARLESWTRARFPEAERIVARWSGQVMESMDGLAFIGRNPLDADNVYVATGDSGMGMTHGTIAGLLLTDLILGRDNPWTELYDPARVPLAAAGSFLRENLNVARQYGDWLTAGDVPDAQAIPPGSGAVIRRGLNKIAVYRDETGSAHCLSAVCPHLGCVVQWNDTARGWDCPCHGSRFDCYGHVIGGPANRDLPGIE